MAVWYLDTDDEITDAVARLRSATEEHVIFVVPPGSRIATGRINFRLLAREATSRELTLAVASPDEQVRALAASAGVLARASVAEAEASLARGETATAASAPSSSPLETATTVGAGTSGRDAQVSRGAVRPGSRRLGLAVIGALALVVIGGFVALRVLPTAEVSLEPATSALGPLDIEVTALLSPGAGEDDPGQVPAIPVTLQLAVEGTFPASGAATIASRAGGEVVFSSAEQTFDQEIVAGTRLRTPTGVEFETTRSVLLERPAGGGTASVRAPIEAVEAGPEGNVPAGAISIVPSLEPQGISVTNPQPTRGGRLRQTPIVTRSDFDAASVDLRNRLAGALATRLREGDVVAEGLWLYPETARLGSVSLEPTADEAVGASTEEFTLQAAASATVLAVDPAAVEEAMAGVLVEEVPGEMDLLSDTVRIETGEGSVSEDRIVFSGTARGTAAREIDPEGIVARIAGLPVSEARAILEGFGTARVEVWPGFLGDLPDDPARIDLDVLEPATTE